MSGIELMLMLIFFACCTTFFSVMAVLAEDKMFTSGFVFLSVVFAGLFGYYFAQAEIIIRFLKW